MSETEQEVVELLDSVFKITNQIKRVYNQILLLLIFKDNNPNYELLMNNLINRLTTLLNMESEAYIPFDESFLYASVAHNLLRSKVYYASSSSQRYILDRIINRLEKIVIDTMNENIEVFKDQVIDNDGVKYLIGRGLDEEDAAKIMLGYLRILHDSMACRYISMINEEINSTKSQSAKASLLEIKINKLFTNGSNPEKELIKTKFDVVTSNLDDELKTSFNLSEKGKARFVSMQAEKNIAEILESLAKEIEPEIIEELLLYFKTYILYLDDYGLAIIRKLIPTIGLLYSSLNKLNLLKILDGVETLKKAQNKNSQIGNTYN